MARRQQPHVLYTRSRRMPGAPFLKRGVWSSWGAAERQKRIGEEWAVYPIQPGESWPESFAAGSDLDAHYLAICRQRRGELVVS